MQQAESLESFFHDEIHLAMRERKLDAGPLTESYLAGLLANYASQPIDETPLALKLLGAVETTGRARRVVLREVGDTSLYVSGFFGESFSRRTVDIDYYVDMGETAYGELARTPAGSVWAHTANADVYDELAHKFSGFVDVLTVISRRMMAPAGPQDIVRLYEKYKRDGSSWAARKLASMGVQLDGAVNLGQRRKPQ